jgi:deoxycytidine triphosphate deaminase
MIHIMSDRSESKLTNVSPEDVQPNAVDLKLGKVFFISPNVFVLSEQEKKHRGTIEIQPDEQGWYQLDPGSYEVVMDNMIKVGQNEAGWVITRSTLNRNGVFLTSGLYDSGYHGVMAGVMHINIAPIRIKQGTRIGQYISFKAESLRQYDGSYGIGKEHDKKYEG